MCSVAIAPEAGSFASSGPMKLAKWKKKNPDTTGMRLESGKIQNDSAVKNAKPKSCGNWAPGSPRGKEN